MTESSQPKTALKGNAQASHVGGLTIGAGGGAVATIITWLPNQEWFVATGLTDPTIFPLVAGGITLLGGYVVYLIRQKFGKQAGDVAEKALKGKK